MPSGYTSEIANGITFERFALGCARAFGALIIMRDDPKDAPIPEAFEPSPHYAQWLRAAEAERDRLREMTNDQIRDAAAQAHKTAHAKWKKRKAEREDLRQKYETMLAQARAYVPPSPEHVEFKNFMVSQIEQSIAFDCDKRWDNEPQPVDHMEWHRKQTEEAVRKVAQYAEEHAKEIERTNQRNTWIRLLRESLSPKEEAA